MAESCFDKRIGDKRIVFQPSVFLRFIRLSIIRLSNFMPLPAVPEMQHASERSPGLSMCQHDTVFFRLAAIAVRLKVSTTKAQRHEEEQMPDAMIFVPSCLCGYVFLIVGKRNGRELF